MTRRLSWVSCAEVKFEARVLSENCRVACSQGHLPPSGGQEMKAHKREREGERKCVPQTTGLEVIEKGTVNKAKANMKIRKTEKTQNQKKQVLECE